MEIVRETGGQLDLREADARRVERGPRCAVSVADFDLPTGLVRHVGMRGRAYLEPHGGERVTRLLSRYIDWA